MASKRFNPEQIIQHLREAESLLAQGKTIAQVCQTIGIAHQTYIRWRKEYGDILRSLKCVVDSSSTTTFHHGATVSDPFRWLERMHSDSVKQWVTHENQLAQQYIQKLPMFAKLKRKYRRLRNSHTTNFHDLQYRHGTLCGLRNGSLVVLESPDNPTPVLKIVDPSRFFPRSNADIDFYELSPDGEFVAVCISVNCSEDGSVYVFRTNDGHRVGEPIPQVSGPPGGNLKWNYDGSGFYYTKYPFAALKEVADRWRYSCQEIWLHKIDDHHNQDSYVTGDNFHRFPQCHLVSSSYDDKLIIQVAHGSGGTGNTYYLVSDGRIELLLTPDAEVAWIDFVSPDSLIMESCQNAPYGKLVKYHLQNDHSPRQEDFLNEKSSVLFKWRVGKKFIYATHFAADGLETLSVLDKNSAEVVSIFELPAFSAITQMCVMEEDRLLFCTENYLEPNKWFLHDPDTNETQETALSAKSSISFDDIQVRREWATSADGARIPMTILRPASCVQDANRPTMVSVYGGSKIRETPCFDKQRRVWFDHGGIWVFVHPRGEGELGEHWFRATIEGNSKLTRDDTVACLEHLVKLKYTQSNRLALIGGSHGGLVAAMVLTHRPELMAAISIDSGAFCVLQHEMALLGSHLKLEYGNSADRIEFQRMINYSPYQQVSKGVAYPSVWLRAGFLDRRVMPWNTWKMGARLKEANTAGPVLVSTKMNEGHDATFPLEEELAFVLSALDVSLLDEN